MAENGNRIRVTLLWVQVLDKLEPFFKEKGEFRFKAKLSSDNRGGITKEINFPEEGFYEVSDHPAWNKVVLNKVLFEGEVDDHLVVELMGEELDTMSANDLLDHYKRVFTGSPDQWVGWYGPGDERSGDPENLSNWRVCYEIEKV